MKKLLSIIVPSYNMEKYLPKCLGSLIVEDSELLQSLDVIVVNDGSKDGTSEIAHEFERKCPGVFRVIDKQNGHYGSCINAGLKIAKGTYVKILDADDTFDTVRFSAFLGFLGKCTEPIVDLVLSDVEIVDEDGNVVSRVSYGGDGPTIVIHEFCDLLKNDGFVGKYHMHGVAYQTDMLRRLSYCQSEGIAYTDNEWTILPMRGVSRYVVFPQVVYRYLVGREGQSVSAAVLERNAWMIRKSFWHILIECTKRLSELDWWHKEYDEQWLSWRSVNVYESSLFSGVSTESCIGLRKIDDCLKMAYPDVWRSLADRFVLFGRLPIRFRYLTVWRRMRRFGGVVLIFVLSYNWIRGKLTSHKIGK